MVFNSFEFLAFLAVVWPLYWLLPLGAQRVLLLVASYAFYMAWRAPYALLLVASTLVDYGVGLGLERWRARQRVRRLLLLTSLSVNLGLLFTFKYWGLFGRSLEALAGLIRLELAWPGLDVLLPVGISFYTFQTLSYTIDLYRGRIRAEHSFVTFALYVSFFPQLVAGPIERASHLLPQFLRRRTWRTELVLHGLKLILIGLFKKMAIGDNLAPIVEATYATSAVPNPVDYCLATYAFAFQIYADFSGYSDIAVGVAALLGFDLMANFDTPYFARSPVEFWHRWHISLSTWLRDYLYIPLGGNRKGTRRTYVNLMLTMLLGGLWHGANWTFVVWGALNGLYLAATKALAAPLVRVRRAIGLPGWLCHGLGWLLTFHLIWVSWIFFRAQNLEQAVAIIRMVATALASGALFAPEALARWGRLLELQQMQWWLVAVMLLVDAWVREGKRLERIQRVPLPLRQLAWAALVLLTLTYGVYQAHQFIYFQF